MSSIIDLANRKIEERAKVMREAYERHVQDLRKVKEDAIAEVKSRLGHAAEKFVEEVKS